MLAAASTVDANEPAESLDARMRRGGGDAFDRTAGLGISGGGDVARDAENDPLSTLFEVDLLRRGFCTFESASIWSYTAHAFSHVRNQQSIISPARTFHRLECAIHGCIFT